MFPSTSSYTTLAAHDIKYTAQSSQLQQQYAMPKSPSISSQLSNMSRFADRRTSNSEGGGRISPAQMSLRSSTSYVPTSGNPEIFDSVSLLAIDDTLLQPSSTNINLQIFVPELQIQKCLTVGLDETVWDIKRKVIDSLPKKFEEYYNYGLFLPPCDGRAGKFLLEDRSIRDYPFHDCVPYLELKYKKRVYKMLQLDEKAVKNLHSKTNLKKFMNYVQEQQAEKIEKMCRQGLDPNFHDARGYTPLTLAAEIPDNRDVLVQLVGGGAHLDFRGNLGQTAIHRAAFLSLKNNVETLIELGASPNYRDSIGLTPLYYNMINKESDPQVAEFLLIEGAEIFVHDIYANDPLHQACKNGLVAHAELLLFYGSNINAQNVNGNTPLHVCAVHNRVDCAQMLLFRGADVTILNKKGETPKQVADILNNRVVSDRIQTHNPKFIVPFCGTPKYNTKRRKINSQMQRRRSLSHSSMSSMHYASNDYYQAPGIRPQLTPKCANSDTTSNYDTLKKYPPEMVHTPQASIVEPNIPRILVIPRGPKGFGFILRGANHLDPNAPPFEPTITVPALQFFEGVETTGMAMKAGLRPGDFLLEINGIDVRRASHEQVVEIINETDDTISLKVITVDQNLLMMPPYASTLASRRNQSVPRNYGSYGNGGSGLPPMPPQRNPITALAYGKPESNTISASNGYAFASTKSKTNQQQEQIQQQSFTFNDISSQNFLHNSSSIGTHNNVYNSFANYNNNASQGGENISYGGVSDSGSAKISERSKIFDFSDGVSSASTPPSPLSSVICGSNASSGVPPRSSTEKCGSVRLSVLSSTNSENGMYLANSGDQHYAPGSTAGSHYGTGGGAQQLRCASVKSRPSPSRRISAAELEHLMIRQSTSASAEQSPTQFQQQLPAFLNYNQDSLKSNSGNNGKPKKFTSIAEMKRRKEQANNPVLQRANNSVNNNGGGVIVRQSAHEYLEDGDDTGNSPTMERFRGPGAGELKSFNSSPNLANRDGVVNFRHHSSNDDSEDYGTSRRPVLRPKTPPPPPPPALSTASKNDAQFSGTGFVGAYGNSENSSGNTTPRANSSASGMAANGDETIYVSASTPPVVGSNARPSAPSTAGGAPPPPPPPPPPPNFLKNSPAAKPNNTNSSKPTDNNSLANENSKNPKTTNCRGISAEALMSVKLKKVGSQSSNANSLSSSQRAETTSTSGAAVAGVSPRTDRKTAASSPALDFDVDLRLALARRRSKVCAADDDTSFGAESESDAAKFRADNSPTVSLAVTGGAATKTITSSTTIAGRYGGLSLRESVQENVQTSKSGGNKARASHHSPTGGVLSFATKKDSGYTSSRTSLEPSECGDDPQPRVQQQSTLTTISSTSSSSNTLADGANSTMARFSNDSTIHIAISPTKTSISGDNFTTMSRVTLISQQLEDNFGRPITQMHTTSDDNKVGGADFPSDSLFLQSPVYTPPVDYDNEDKASSDSGKSSSGELNSPCGDSASDPNAFQFKPLIKWSVDDVGHWLAYLRLPENYARIFAARAINGERLARFNRAAFTQMGVTRVAHRQAMENSLKDFSNGK